MYNNLSAYPGDGQACEMRDYFLKIYTFLGCKTGENIYLTKSDYVLYSHPVVKSRESHLCPRHLSQGGGRLLNLTEYYDEIS